MKRAKQRPTSRKPKACATQRSNGTKKSSKVVPPKNEQLVSAQRTAVLIRKWRHVGAQLMTRDRLAAETRRCIGTVRNWERESAPREPRVSDLRSMEKAKPGLIRLLFPEPFRVCESSPT